LTCNESRKRPIPAVLTCALQTPQPSFRFVWKTKIPNAFEFHSGTLLLPKWIVVLPPVAATVTYLINTGVVSA
jgi:hypothetical protein